MAKKIEEFKTEKGVFLEHIQKAGLRRTAQRDLILEIFLRTEEHLTSEDLYWLAKNEPSVEHRPFTELLNFDRAGWRASSFETTKLITSIIKS